MNINKIGRALHLPEVPHFLSKNRMRETVEYPYKFKLESDDNIIFVFVGDGPLSGGQNVLPKIPIPLSYNK